jgi:hypothetical protein
MDAHFNLLKNWPPDGLSWLYYLLVWGISLAIRALLSVFKAFDPTGVKLTKEGELKTLPSWSDRYRYARDSFLSTTSFDTHHD